MRVELAWASAKGDEKLETKLTGLAAMVLKVTFIFHSHGHFNRFKHFIASTEIHKVLIIIFTLLFLSVSYGALYLVDSHYG